MALTEAQQAQYDSLVSAGASESAAMSAASLVPDRKTSKNNPGTDEFMSQLSSRLLGQADLISSDSTALESKITEAIKTVQGGTESGNKAVDSAFDRAIGQQAEKGAQNLTAFREAGAGYATNTAALDKIQKDTDTQLKDLEQRKQELILQNNAQAASQISQLQVQAIQFRQQAQQQVFSNLLGIANFGLQARAQQQAESQFNRQMSFQESSAISGIALQYGLTVRPGESLDSITTRAQPFASQKQQLELQKTRTEIAKLNADIRAASEGSFDGISTAALAAAARSNPALLSALATKSPKQALQVQSEIDKLESQDVTDTITDAKNRKVGLNQTIEAIQNDPNIWNKGEAIRKATEAFKDVEEAKSEPVTLPSVGKGLFDFGVEANAYIYNFVTGKPISDVWGNPRGYIR